MGSSLLPSNPSLYSAQRLCTSTQLTHGTTKHTYAQSVLSRTEGGQRSRVCIDVNKLPPSSDCEDEATPFIFGFCYNTHTSANGQNCVSRDQKSGPATCAEPMKESHSRHGRTFDCVSQDASGGAPIARRKLWLSKAKLAVLEERFKKHNALDAKEKIALAKQLNLQPRQVEVWFQNRRAKTKIKQIKVDCKVLKRFCEALSEENRRLQEEILELRALTIGGQYMIPGFNMHFPGTTLTMGSLCDFLTSPSVAVALAAPSTTTSISSLNQPSSIGSTLSSHQQPSPACS